MSSKIKDFREIENVRFSSDKENYLSFIASFLIVLVLTIPLYTSSAYASIGKITVKGNDGIENFAKSTDSLNINVQAFIANDAITNDQVVLGSDIKFDSCTASVSNGSDCTLKFPGNGTEQFESKSVPFTVNLFKDDRTIDDSKSGSITIDSKPPVVKLNSSSKFSSQQNVVISYNATDFACDDSSCSGKCVGIKSIELYTSNGAFRQAINPAASDCSAVSSISIDTKTFNNGLNSVFAKATDKFGQVSAETSVTFTVDGSGPEIAANSFEISRKGVSISSFAPVPVNVDVSVNISGNDLDLNSVKADLSSLNPSLKNAKASCAAVESGISACKWNIELKPGTGGAKEIVINSSDTSGNMESASLSKFLALDDNGPVIVSLATPYSIEGNYIARPNDNTVIAVFDEAAGLSADEVSLEIDEQFRAKATSCSKQPNWVCVWESINFGKSGQISIGSDTTDILGNAIDGKTYVGISVDPLAPVARSITITPIGGLAPAFPGFAKIGDKIAVVANVTENNDVFAVADFSDFISGNSRVAGSCERLQADEHVCAWVTDTVNLESSGFIKFNFSDNAGNTLIVTRSFKTFGIENATVPDFWSNSVSCSPSVIDRELGPLINQRMYCQVSLKQKSITKPVSTVFIGPASCSGNGASLVQNVETLNTEAGSSSPIIKITLKRDDFKINDAELSCSFNIFSKIGSGTSITKNPEIENAKITLQFFNNPLGELSQSVQGEINSAKNDARGIWDLIGTLNKIVFYAKRICMVINTLVNMLSVFYFIWGIMKTGELTCKGTIYANIFGACAAIQAQASTSCVSVDTAAGAGNQPGTVEGIYQGLNWACDVVNCKITPLWGPTVKDFINNNLPLALSPGQYAGSKTTIEQKDLGFGTVKPVEVKGGDNNPIKLGRPISEYMDPNKNIAVAALFACLPGIIYGLEKWRQIQCLYADCLQNAVGKEGLPVTVCQDQKHFATCKYLTTELFAIFPWTVLFDHFMKLIKNAISNPFAAAGVVVAVFCKPTCGIPAEAGGQLAFHTCRGLRLLNLVGTTAENVKNIIDEGFTIREDYCTRLEDDDKDDDVKNPAATKK
ncbi:hypothetical protein HYV80_06575 [Candidatus Woesearchaeota archaeon]|nr:hypothetical protein [Candidatus Woesearchaeota archaeon]